MQRRPKIDSGGTHASRKPATPQRPQVSPAPVEPPKPEAVSAPLIAPDENGARRATIEDEDDQAIRAWLEQIGVYPSALAGLLDCVKSRSHTLGELQAAYGSLQSDTKVAKPLAVLIHRIKEGSIGSGIVADMNNDTHYQLMEDVKEALVCVTDEMEDEDVVLADRLYNAAFEALLKLRTWEDSEEGLAARNICRYIGDDGKPHVARKPRVNLMQLLSECVGSNFDYIHFKLSPNEIAQRVMTNLPQVVPSVEDLKIQYAEQREALRAQVSADYGPTWPADEPLPNGAAEQAKRHTQEQISSTQKADTELFSPTGCVA